MEISLAEIITVSIFGAGVISGYARLTFRVSMLSAAFKEGKEAIAAAALATKEVDGKVETLRKDAATDHRTIDAKIEAIRKDQGVRIGEIRTDINHLAGFTEGFKAARRRLRTSTAPQGLPAPPEDDEQR